MTGFAADDPRFLQTDDLDAVLRMTMEVASEVWVLRDRFTVLEHLLERHGAVTREMLDAHEPDAALATELRAARERFLRRLVEAAGPHGSDVTAAEEVA